MSLAAFQGLQTEEVLAAIDCPSLQVGTTVGRPCAQLKFGAIVSAPEEQPANARCRLPVAAFRIPPPRKPSVGCARISIVIPDARDSRSVRFSA